MKGSGNIITTSEKLEIALKRQGFTKKEVAEKLGVSQPTISKKFKYNDWRESDVKEICHTIGINCEMVLKFEDGTVI
ncbi:helix-turn-helix transcriptional regulator [Anaerocolumna aminovalerica]|uniref:helix-turn-helix domain-containing protein n=1 Tax=Anaerocolumna aminovalerica TaxID=1527 RepID=UPI001C0E94F8|nr:helix-turn-helix transcriptional regulator [Anaerocolumna aminovalerica]